MKEGIKLDGEKPRTDLVLGGFAKALLEVSKVGTVGAAKYSDHGWRKVENGLERYKSAMLRHYIALSTGEEIDEETGMLHSAMMAWNALAVVELCLPQAEEKGGLIFTKEESEGKLKELFDVGTKREKDAAKEAHNKRVEENKGNEDDVAADAVLISIGKYNTAINEFWNSTRFSGASFNEKKTTAILNLNVAGAHMLEEVKKRNALQAISDNNTFTDTHKYAYVDTYNYSYVDYALSVAEKLKIAIPSKTEKATEDDVVKAADKEKCTAAAQKCIDKYNALIDARKSVSVYSSIYTAGRDMLDAVAKLDGGRSSVTARICKQAVSGGAKAILPSKL